MQVREIMTANPACCTPESSLKDVAQMMEKNDCGCIPVVDSMDAMKPVGTITDRDITIRTVAANHNPINMKASDIMTFDVATVRPETSVEECFDVMEDKEIRRVLVVDEQGKCCGIVAQADVVQSNVNPVRTNKVIREISESAPSRNPEISPSRGTGGWNFQSHSSGESFFGSGSLLPLLIGFGSGAAVMYLWNMQQTPDRRDFFADRDAYSFDDHKYMTEQEIYGKYSDPDEEIEKRQHDLENRVHSLRTEPGSPIDRTDQINREDEPVIKDKGRSAGQGS